jgi:diaminohydroxyphosphoribosylaminopyrimidine deaminase/5-amino-6-(5-phosphoribosylamino)uracil reductase
VKESDLDRRYMALALRLAARGQGQTSPNPMVGAVVVADGRIVGQGYHQRAGGPHAELIALRAAGSRTKGATLYVSLEPCSHTAKRTPPCVPLLVASGLRRVVVAMKDPNPSVNGKGIRALRKAGVDVSVGCLGNEAERLNEVYAHWITTGRPFVILKTAMTLDGKIAASSGDSQWITGEAARHHAHGLRSRVDAILTGIGTVLHDDPQLTVRWTESGSRATTERQPLRVILDSRLRIPLNARVLSRPPVGGAQMTTLIATTERGPKRRLVQLQERGAQVLVLPALKGRVPLSACLAALGRRGVTSVLIEAGSEVNASALREKLLNRVCFYVAPRLLGGREAFGVFGGASPKHMKDSLSLTDLRVTPIGKDLLIEGTVPGRQRRSRTR